MAALGAVRVPLEFLEFSERRQISFKVRERLTRVLKNLSKVGGTKIHIPCIVEEAKLNQILARLGFYADQLRGTLKKGEKSLPLLTGIRLTCLYGEYLAAALKRNDEASLIVHLFSAERRLSGSHT